MVEKRSQLERLTIAEVLMVSVMEELTEGKTENVVNTLQAAVNCQIEANRIVWKLNEVMKDNA